jgi:uncharacterized protein DUF6527
MRQTHFSYQIVEFIPERLEEGVLYVSQRYRIVVHKCACGCGEEVVTPLSPTDWSIQMTGGTATLHPSIGNWSFVCRSHYFIRRGRVVWAGQLSRRQIERGRAFDRKARQQYFEDVNRQKGLPPQNFLYEGWAALKHWWNS